MGISLENQMKNEGDESIGKMNGKMTVKR